MRRLLACACVLALGPLSGDHKPELMIYGASSLRDVLRDVAPACERRTGTRVVLNLAASSHLARQIVAANKADLFLSADEHWMDHVARAGLIDPPSRRTLLSNRLVVVAPRGSHLEISGPADLLDPEIRRLSLADPSAVPAGKYARSWLQSEGCWEGLSGRIVPAADVRAVLAAVEMGVVDAGVVYRTDAMTSAKVRVLLEVPEVRGPRISYPIAALGSRPNLKAARKFADCLSGPDAVSVFEQYGFIAR